MENRAQQLELDDFSLKYYRDALGDDFHHVEVRHPDLRFSGFGSAPRKELAVQIAVSECLERQVFADKKGDLQAKSSTGFAVHYDSEIAKENSICEALERDAVIVHWLLKIPPYWLKDHHLKWSHLKTIELFKSKGFEVRFGVLSVTNSRFCVCGYLSYRGDGYVFSSSCRQKLVDAVDSILGELRRAATVILNRKTANLPLYDDDYNRKDGFYHFQYYLSRQHASDLRWFVEGQSKEVRCYNFVIETLPVEMSYEMSWRLFSAFSRGCDLQTFYFGDAHFKEINRSRLRRTWRKGQKLNKGLHYLP